MVRRKLSPPFPRYRPSDQFLDAVYTAPYTWRELAARADLDPDNIRGYFKGRLTIGPRVYVKFMQLAESLGIPPHQALVSVDRSAEVRGA
jgi:hypothetical protein